MMKAAAASPITKMAAKTTANAGVKCDGAGGRSKAGAATDVPQPTQNFAPDITGVPHCGQNRITIASTLLWPAHASRPAPKKKSQPRLPAQPRAPRHPALRDTREAGMRRQGCLAEGSAAQAALYSKLRMV
jgi:hypothetical protein